MSYNSKNRRHTLAAKVISAMHKSGGKGPSRTVKTNTKKKAWYQLLKTVKFVADVLPMAHEIPGEYERQIDQPQAA